MDIPIDYEVAQLRLPPHSTEAEQAVIGGLLIGHNNFDLIADELAADDFYRPEHRAIFSAIERLVDDGQPHDAVTVCDSLSAAGELDRAGGAAYVFELARNTPSAANIRAYATAVTQRARGRRLIQIGQKITNIAWDESQSIDEREEQAQAELLTLGDNAGDDIVSTNAALKIVIDEIDRRYESGNELTGLTTGFADIDKRTRGLQPGNLILIAGRPSMGKTTLAMNIVEHVAFTLRKSALVFSMEMSRNELFERMIASIGGIRLDAILTGKFHDDEWSRLSRAVSVMKDSPLIVDDRPALSIQQMRSRARKLHKKTPLSLIVVDYLQLAAAKATRSNENREQEISSISRGLKALAKELNCPVIAVAQLNRNCESRPNKRPINSDLRDSGQIEQDADLICMMYRDEYYNADTPDKGIAEAIWRKFRNGQCGTDWLAARLDQSRFLDLDPASRPATSNITPINRKRGGFEYE